MLEGNNFSLSLSLLAFSDHPYLLQRLVGDLIIIGELDRHALNSIYVSSVKKIALYKLKDLFKKMGL